MEAPTAREQSRSERAERRRARTTRFMQRYEERRLQRLRGEQHFIVRPFRIAIGVFLVALAPFVGAIPGPGGMLIFLPGAFLLAGEVRRAAIIMDRMENETIPRIRRTRARLRGGPRPEWVEQDPQLWADWCDARQIDLPGDGTSTKPDDAQSA